MLSAAILIGGKASRFDGRDKGALLVDGRTILSRQLAALATLAPAGEMDVMLVGGTARTGVPQTVRHIPDLVPGCGPLGGLHAALSAATGPAALMLACDMPFVTAPLMGYLFSLAGGAERTGEGADVVVPRTERGYHPLCAVYTRACLEPAARRLARGEFKLTGLFEEVRVREVKADALAAFGDPDRLLANVNTSTEYRAIEVNGVQS